MPEPAKKPTRNPRTPIGNSRTPIGNSRTPIGNSRWSQPTRSATLTSPLSSFGSSVAWLYLRTRSLGGCWQRCSSTHCQASASLWTKVL